MRRLYRLESCRFQIPTIGRIFDKRPFVQIFVDTTTAVFTFPHERPTLSGVNRYGLRCLWLAHIALNIWRSGHFPAGFTMRDTLAKRIVRQLNHNDAHGQGADIPRSFLLVVICPDPQVEPCKEKGDFHVGVYVSSTIPLTILLHSGQAAICTL